MSESSATDILQPVPEEQWPFVRDLTKDKWPYFAYIYYWLENAIDWKKRRPDWDIQVYCPNGDYKSGTFVAISNISLYLVIVFTQDSTGDALRKVITETKRIDWMQGVYFCAVHGEFLPTMVSVTEYMGQLLHIGRDHITPGMYYFKSAEECAAVDIQVPNECYVKKLDESHIPFIHSIWPHRDPDRPDLSMKYLTTFIELNEGIGLFLKKDDSLVSWVLHSDWNGLGMVQTVEEHKRKGYARVVINTLAKRLAKKGIPSTAFVIDTNTPSQLMFKKLGWKPLAKVAWVVMNRPTSNGHQAVSK